MGTDRRASSEWMSDSAIPCLVIWPRSSAPSNCVPGRRIRFAVEDHLVGGAHGLSGGQEPVGDGRDEPVEDLEDGPLPLGVPQISGPVSRPPGIVGDGPRPTGEAALSPAGHGRPFRSWPHARGSGVRAAPGAG